jgi:hypothetical protein
LAQAQVQFERIAAGTYECHDIKSTRQCGAARGHVGQPYVIPSADRLAAFDGEARAHG